jgi:transposase
MLAKGIEFELVKPWNTSRTCPVCGHIEEANRNGLVFRCKSCNYQDNADRVGATNIALRSLFQRQAVGERAVCQPAYSSHEGDCSSELQAPIL